MSRLALDGSTVCNSNFNWPKVYNTFCLHVPEKGLVPSLPPSLPSLPPSLALSPLRVATSASRSPVHDLYANPRQGPYRYPSPKPYALNPKPYILNPCRLHGSARALAERHSVASIPKAPASCSLVRVPITIQGAKE